MVVGTLNMDLIVTVDRRPEVGETVLGNSLTERPGGKGANQALAAARHAPTRLVGAVGDDESGRRMLDAQRDGGVDVEGVAVHPGPSGRAVIEVDASGDNRIVVISGANADLTAAEVTAALDAAAPGVVLTQLESPSAVTAAVAAWAEQAGRRFVLNPSPAADVDPAVLAAADPLVVNEGEARFYLGRQAGAAGHDVDPAADPEAAGRALLGIARSAVITLGGDGVVVADAEAVSRIPVEPVTAAETTGAGDHFAGTLVGRLAGGEGLHSAARSAADSATAYIAARGSR